MLVFHTLSAGNIGQLGAPATVVPATALAAGGADTDGTADDGGVDGDVLGWAECPAETLRVEVLCAGRGAGAALAPAEQPLLAAVIAIKAATALARAVRMVTYDVTGIIVASWHGPAERSGDPVKSHQDQAPGRPALRAEAAVERVQNFE